MHIITKPTASSQGLSMLELMVAVVIIVLLVSISFPVTLQIRQQAATSVTISHMRDILTGFATYASDHDNRYPGMKLVNKDGGEERWLGANGPIFRQLYRNGNAGPDYIEAGAHLFRTVFVNEQSVKAFPDELDYYNHTYCFNVSLITDALNKDDPDCIYQSRSRFLFPSESQTMLIIEADGRDMNTIQWRDTGRLERAMARNWNKFILAGFIDGSVSKIRQGEIPESPTTDNDSAYFWTGLDKKTYLAYEKNERGLNASSTMDVYSGTAQ